MSVTRALRGHVRVLIDTSVWIHHFGEHEKSGAQATKVIELIPVTREILLTAAAVSECSIRPSSTARVAEVIANAHETAGEVVRVHGAVPHSQSLVEIAEIAFQNGGELEEERLG